MNLNVRNAITVALVQALLGAISQNFRGVLLTFSEELHVRFYLEVESDVDSEEIDDVVTEFDGLLMGIHYVPIKYDVVVGRDRIDCSCDNVMPIFLRRR
ncbi:hypothetical protein D9M68_711390 [compost metagenome]